MRYKVTNNPCTQCQGTGIKRVEAYKTYKIQCDICGGTGEASYFDLFKEKPQAKEETVHGQCEREGWDD